jgi:dTDP-4-amino-4,6-dideoxygalactose transaminase
VALSSGTAAIHMALKAAEVAKGDIVLCQSFTFSATVNPIIYEGAIPVFIDSDPVTWNLDLNLLRKALEEYKGKVKAVMVVHLYGQAANMIEIMKIARKHDLKVVEDCAQSHGAKYNERTTGTIGDIGCFSFYPTKNLGAFGDAGAIVTDNSEIFKKVMLLRNYGSSKKYHNEIIGVNSRLDEIQAALLNVKLSHYDDLLENRKLIVNEYLSGIKNPHIILPSIASLSTHVWHLFIIRTINRDELIAYLNKHNIESQIHYPIPPHLSTAYDNLGFQKGSFPVTERNSEEILSLPLYDWMTKEEAKYVVDVLNSFVGKKDEN